MDHIYLDHNATTPVDPEVTYAMTPYLGEIFGNASSVHQFGRDAKVALENAREQIASFIGAKPSELFFTSGGTESDNLAMFGVARRFGTSRNHLVVGSTEHHAILEPAEYLHHHEDYLLDLLSVDRQGFASVDSLKPLLTSRTALVSVMHANNETGTIQNLPPLVEAAHEIGALFHTDAVQSIGKVRVDVNELGVDLLSLTGHKIYGPKGAGALYVREGVKIAPLFYGGAHEKKRRPGTENVAGAVGLARTLEIAERRRDADHKTLTELADYFINRLLSEIPDTHFNGPRNNRIPQTINVSFPGSEGEALLLSLDMEGIACSSGSACTAGATEPSHVLTAMGIPRTIAQSAVRFSLGRSTTRDQLDYVLAKLPAVVQRLRAMSPTYDK
jgi:cysteine desulfurase